MADSSFYLANGAVTVQPNIKQGQPRYIGISVIGGSAIRVRNYLVDRSGNRVNVGYAANLDYRKWTLTGANTDVRDDADKALYVFARLDASSSGTTGIVMLSAVEHDVYETTESSSYYYIKLGHITAPDAETSQRVLDEWDTGELDTNQGRDNSASGNFDRAFSLGSNSITPLLPFAGLEILSGYALKLFNVTVNAIKTATAFSSAADFAAWISSTAIATTQSIASFVAAKIAELDSRFIRKDQDDATTHKLTIGEVNTDTIKPSSENEPVTLDGNVSVTGDVSADGSLAVGGVLSVSYIQNSTALPISVGHTLVLQSGADLKLVSGFAGSSSFSGDIVTGFGWRIANNGAATFESLSVRKFFEVPEFRFNRVEVTQGIAWRAPAAGVVKDVSVGSSVRTRTVVPETQIYNMTDTEIGGSLGDDVIIYHGKVYSEEDAPDTSKLAFGMLQLTAGSKLTVAVDGTAYIQLLKSPNSVIALGDELVSVGYEQDSSTVDFAVPDTGYYVLAVSKSMCVISVTTEDTADGYIDLKLEQGEIGSFSYDDICQGIFHNEDGSKNAAADDESAFQFAGFCTVYFRVVDVADYVSDGTTYKNGRVYYSMRTGYVVHPQQSMTVVGYGNFSNTERQTSAYSTRTYERKLVNVNDWTITQANIAMHIGKMDGLLADYTGYSAYLNNIYFSGVIRQLDVDGNEVVVLNYRGDYSASAIYKLNDEAYYDGALWVWQSQSAGSGVTPSASAAQWKKVGGKGDTGKGIASQQDQYCLSDSASSLVNPSSWQTAVPTYTLGRYIWRRTVTTYSDNSSITSDAVCVQGLTGAAIRPRGEWNSSASYVNNTAYCDVVLYNGSYYKAKRDSTGQVPYVNGGVNTSYWEQFNDFQNVATSVLLAQDGYIDVLGSGSIFVGQSSNGTGWYLTGGAIQWRRYVDNSQNYVVGVTLNYDGTLSCGDSGKLTLMARQLVCENKVGDRTAWLDELGNFITAGVQSQLVQVVDTAAKFADIFVMMPDCTEFFNDYADYSSASAAQTALDGSVNIYDENFVFDAETETAAVAVAPISDSSSPLSSVGYGNHVVSAAASLDMRAAAGIIDLRYRTTVGETSSQPTHKRDALFAVVLPYVITDYENGTYKYSFRRTPTRMNGEQLHFLTSDEIKQIVGRQVVIVNHTSNPVAVHYGVLYTDAKIIYPDESYRFDFVIDNSDTATVTTEDLYGGTFTHEVALPKYIWQCADTEPSAIISDSRLTQENFGEDVEV